MCDTTPLRCGTWLIQMSAVTHSHVRRDSFRYVTWLIYICLYSCAMAALDFFFPCVHIHIWTYACTCVNMSMLYISIGTSIIFFWCVCPHAHTHINVCMYECRVCMYVYIYEHIHFFCGVCLRTHTHIKICIYVNMCIYLHAYPYFGMNGAHISEWIMTLFTYE